MEKKNQKELGRRRRRRRRIRSRKKKIEKEESDRCCEESEVGEGGGESIGVQMEK